MKRLAKLGAQRVPMATPDLCRYILSANEKKLSFNINSGRRGVGGGGGGGGGNLIYVFYLALCGSLEPLFFQV